MTLSRNWSQNVGKMYKRTQWNPRAHILSRGALKFWPKLNIQNWLRENLLLILNMKIEQRSKRIVQYSYSSYHCAFTCTVYNVHRKNRPSQKSSESTKTPFDRGISSPTTDYSNTFNLLKTTQCFLGSVPFTICFCPSPKVHRSISLVFFQIEKKYLFQ